MKPALALALAFSLTAFAVSAAPADRAALLREAMENGFGAAEETRLAAGADGDVAALKTLAEFYAAHQLWPEALAALARIKTPDADTEALAAEAQYRFGRHDRVAALAPSGEDVVRSFRAMALTRRGSFVQAVAAFQGTAAPAGLEADYQFCLAEALAATGDGAGAQAALKRAEDFATGAAEQSRRRFLLAMALLQESETERAGAELRRAAAGPDDDWSMRARLALAGEQSLSAFSLAWRSAAFDRDLLMRRAAQSAMAGDKGRALDLYAEMAARFPDSDAALAAEGKAAAVLATLFDDASLSAAEAARVFFDHVAFALPGREGDALIRRAADRLKTLGLHAEAAALLDHQVFKRLRGADRSRVAADLADLHLAAKAPRAALAAIRATRIAGLDAPTNARRRRLEATALAALGKREAALTLLDDATDNADIRLRASIAWDASLWPQSAADYAAAFAAAPPALSREDREAAVRAATAFLLAGDRDGYRAFVATAAPRLQGAREEAMIRSLGDVDRDAFLGRFMDNYRALYGAAPGR